MCGMYSREGLPSRRTSLLSAMCTTESTHKMVSSLLPIVGEVLDCVVLDKAGNERAKRDLEGVLAQAAVKGQLGQLEIDQVETAHQSVFVANRYSSPGGEPAADGSTPLPWYFVLLSRLSSSGKGPYGVHYRASTTSSGLRWRSTRASCFKSTTITSGTRRAALVI